MALRKPCNTLLTTGANLQDIPKLKDKLTEAIRLHAQDPGSATYPKSFDCSHCGNEHAITPEGVKYILFQGPGAYDFTATFNEYFAMVNDLPASSVGTGVTSSSDKDFFDIPVAEEEIEDPEDPDNPELVEKSEDDNDKKEEVVK